MPPAAAADASRPAPTNKATPMGEMRPGLNFLGPLAGGQNGHFFKILPPYVDPEKPPGFSEVPKPTVMDWVYAAVSLRHVWASPNTVWSAIALAMYFLVPYDLAPDGVSAAAPLSWAFFAARLPLWLAVTFGYTAFWHITLYGLGWAERPFIADRPYNWDKVAHNLFWSLMGVIVWTGFDNVFAFLWATGRLGYLSDEQAFSSVLGMTCFLVGLAAVPLWRDVHFYFAHRLLHFKPMYQQVHSLHHRNTDIEPFSGLSMHPVEHLYYYACILPSLLSFVSPFHFLWNGVHLLLAPGASHSGWEDHFQADAYHYMHHRYFECNYSGTPAAALDVMFGTFMGKFKGNDDAGQPKVRADAKSTLRTVPSLEFVGYLLASALCVGGWAYVAHLAGWQMHKDQALLLSLLPGFGPVLLAWVFSFFSSTKGGGASKSWAAALFHFVVGTLFCSVPVSVACYLASVPPAA
eukprot:m.64630 g.64630  ORF g.64630 m.64630 type:complete len:463 (-) comp16441_c0_seq1:58-1446(-)